ncbi:MAG: hypothetical protein SPJ12_02810 [Duodenibacillus sp.]|nr:hypothetical protein [Duodenibacillus sp.]
MSDFVSALDAAQSASYVEQKAIRDEVADLQFRLRRAMDQGLTPEDMVKAQAAKAAADAAEDILSNLFA